MARFSIYSAAVLVGHSALEDGDPPMGVVFGRFEPACGYAAIQHECRTNHLDQTGLALSVTTEAGLVIPAMGVAILDYSEALLPECIEASILGIPAACYEQLFAGHVIRYRQSLTQ